LGKLKAYYQLKYSIAFVKSLIDIAPTQIFNLYFTDGGSFIFYK